MTIYQVAFPREGNIPSIKQCGWCDAPAIDEIILEPDRYKYVEGKDGKKIKVLRRRAIIAGVCEVHKKNLQLKSHGKSKS